MHEDLSRKPEVVLSSDRAFGLTWTVLLTLYALAPLRHAAGVRRWPLAAAAAVLLVSLLLPGLLHGPNLCWAKLARVLYRIVNPVVMGLFFYGLLVPLAMLNRILRRDPLRLRRNPEASTYWIARNPPGPSAADMINLY